MRFKSVSIIAARVAGMYYFEAKLTAPVNYSREAGVRDRNMQADGIGVTAPTFEFIGQ